LHWFALHDWTTVEKKEMAATRPMWSDGDVGKRLLNVEEAAVYLGLKVDTVYKKARLRELPYVKVGRALRFDVKALERYVEQHTIKTID
jgi:excisionase family DNA binding protein